MKRVNLLLLLIAFIGLSQTTKAQTTLDSIQAIYDSLDIQYYPKGLLHNRSPFYLYSKDSGFYASPYRFDGSIPSQKVFRSTFSQLYKDMWLSAVDSTRIMAASEVRRQDSLSKLLYEVPIVLMHLDFHSIRDFAVDSGYLYYDTTDNRLTGARDTVWINRDSNVYVYNANPDSLTELAFQQHTLFAGAVMVPALYRPGFTINVEFGLPGQFFIENQTQTPSLVQVDFDDGNGFVTVQWDQARIITYTYAPAGSPEGYEKNIRVRLHYGAKVLESTMHFMLVPGYTPPDIEIFTNNLPLNCVAPVPNQNPVQARVSVRSGNSEREIRKPLLLIEGFESAQRDYADLTYAGAVTGVVTNANGRRVFQQVAQLKDFADSLNLLGYDLVYIDFEDGQADILEAGLTVIQVIQWVNEQLLVNESNEQLVVVGASMGGLIGRYALAKMEADICCHNTRVYTSFDSPHEGANIPIGVQHFVKNLHDQLGFVDDAVNAFGGEDLVRGRWRDVLNSRAAQQLTVVHINPAAAAVRAEFMATLDSLGFPQQCRRLAVINGSEEGLTNGFAPANTDKRMVGVDMNPNLPYAWLPGVSIPSLIPIPQRFNVAFARAYGEANPSGVVFEYTHFRTSVLTALDITLTAGLAQADMTTARALMFIPGLTPICATRILSIKTFANIKLNYLHSLNNPVPLHLFNFAPPNMPNYTEAPGSTQSYSADVGEALGGNSDFLDGYVRVWEPSHCFVPSTSALDIDTNSIYMDINNVRTALTASGKIPFDTYYANSREVEGTVNQRHVQVTQGNRRWMIEQIENRYQLTDTSGGLNYNLFGYYNYARPSDINAPFQKILYSVDIESSGRLYANKQGTIGFVGGSQTPTPGSRFNLVTGNACDDPIVTIKSEGVFMIGDTDINYGGSGQVKNSADVYFKEGSTLIIETGGVLHITDNSRLIIEEGAELVVYPGGVIHIEDAESYLDIQGKLTLKQNAIFAPTGNGFVKFNQDMDDGNTADHLLFEGNNEIHIIGTSTSHKRLEIAHNLYLDQLDSLYIYKARAEIAPTKHLHIYGSLKSKDVHFTSTATSLAAGLRVYGQEYCDISFTEFSKCEEGLRATLNVYGHPLTIRNSNFHNNTIGFSSYAKSAEVLDCQFTYNGTGWSLHNSEGTNKAVDSDFNNNVNYGIDYDGQSGSELQALNNSFSTQYGGILAEGTGTTLKGACNSFSNHFSSGVWATYSNILFDKANGGDNVFSNNPVDIIVVEVTNLAIQKGNNKFSGSTYYIQGTFNSNATAYLTNLGGGQYALDVIGNWMPPVSSALPISLSLSGNPVSQVNWTPPGGFYVTNCSLPGYAGFGADGRNFRKTGGLVISGGDYNGFRLDSAVYDAAGYIGDTASGGLQDLTGLSKLQGIFTYVNANSRYSSTQSGSNPILDGTDQLAMDEAFDFYMLGLSNAYRHELLEPARAETDITPSSYLSDLITEADHRIDYEIGNWEDSEWGEFYFNISKVHAYRSGEHYDLAIEHLESKSEWAAGTTISIAEYWECVCEAESDLILGNIEPAQFVEDLQYCMSLAPEGKKSLHQLPNFPNIPLDDYFKSLEKGLSVNLSPNPSHGEAELQFSEPTKGLKIRIVSSSGSTIQERNIPDDSKNFALRVNAKAGVYYIEVIDNLGIRERIKWVVL